jgi:hypothetical protein
VRPGHPSLLMAEPALVAPALPDASGETRRTLVAGADLGGHSCNRVTGAVGTALFFDSLNRSETRDIFVLQKFTELSDFIRARDRFYGHELTN